MIARYLHRLFQEDAGSYAERYDATEYFLELLSDAFARIGLTEEQRADIQILDIGSGAGNSIFPLLSLCPDAQIIASDLSVDLLAILRRALLETEQTNACVLLQLNAEELDFFPRSFNLVTGAAILHHLLSPEKVFAGCARILKPGGSAIFFEPFEAGNALLSLMYGAILDNPRSTTLLPDIIQCFQSHITECNIRRGRDKTAPVFQQYEDKWLFTQRYIQEMAQEYGFTSAEVYPLHGIETPFTQQTEVLLRLAAGKEANALPTWAWEIVHTYDQHFSEDLKSDLLIEGGIILRK